MTAISLSLMLDPPQKFPAWIAESMDHVLEGHRPVFSHRLPQSKAVLMMDGPRGVRVWVTFFEVDHARQSLCHSVTDDGGDAVPVPCGRVGAGIPAELMRHLDDAICLPRA
ncbi:hypothetical protein [Devosia sp. 1566]|uniref:hypothetical protein n=1 Tax=Devosia sp. 1566 TaxID=2499144 RepID=UPI0013E3EC89|nr:hypothetical protein [Devosia sp. 1566]